MPNDGQKLTNARLPIKGILRNSASVMMDCMPGAVLMCPPTFFDVREVKNPHMHQPIDRVRAQHQWSNLRQALEKSGVTVELIDPQPELDDMVFTANQVFVGISEKFGRFIVPSRMKYRSRQLEVEHFVAWFQEHGYKVLELDLKDEYLEGHGDLLWHPDRKSIWAGHGFRSSRGGVERFGLAMKELGFAVTPLELVDPYCYHLDTCFCPLNTNAALVFPEAFAPESLQQIQQGFERVHRLSREDALQFVLNGVAVNGKYITPRITEKLSWILREEGLTPVLVETSEFEKSGGSVFCMKTFLG